MRWSTSHRTTAEPHSRCLIFSFASVHRVSSERRNRQQGARHPCQQCRSVVQYLLDGRRSRAHPPSSPRCSAAHHRHLNLPSPPTHQMPQYLVSRSTRHAVRIKDLDRQRPNQHKVRTNRTCNNERPWMGVIFLFFSSCTVLM